MKSGVRRGLWIECATEIGVPPASDLAFGAPNVYLEVDGNYNPISPQLKYKRKNFGGLYSGFKCSYTYWIVEGIGKYVFYLIFVQSRYNIFLYSL